MKHLIIPDIHERLDRLAVILRTFGPRVDAVTFLGDWPDTFKKFDEGRIIRTIATMVNLVDNGYEVDGVKTIPCTSIIGNHCAHYLFRHNGFVCSGYDPRKKDIYRDLVSDDFTRKLKLHQRIGPYLLSHAGYGYHNIHLANDAYASMIIERAINGECPSIFGAGKARGGYELTGGPTWLDWLWEFEAIAGIPQIVGHTHGTAVRFKHAIGCPAITKVGECNCKPSICLDTGLNDVAIINETNEVEICEVPAT